MPKYLTRFILLFIIVATLFSCKGLRKITDDILQPTAREIYARDFVKNDSILTAWENQFEAARNNGLQLSEPVVLSAHSGMNEGSALGYAMELKKGDLLHVEVDSDSLNSRFFINFYKDTLNTNQQGDFAKIDERSYSAVIDRNGWHKIVVQPELNFEGIYKVSIYTQPSLGFPVAGKGNADIHSFWGAGRDGGARKHEGVDIFAGRGTPLLAVSEGTVTRTGDRGLGGKQVWLRDGVLGHSVYYAHLDSIIAVPGQRVQPGDTLGTVGNTGNAATTAPHLHFGIYTMGGAVDPYPYIRERAIPEAEAVDFNPDKKVNSAKANVRSGPSTSHKITGSMAQGDAPIVLSFTDGWYHIKYDSIEGFVSGSLLD